MPDHHRHILIYEPSVEGHHVGWLRFITDDLLNAGFQLTLALDTRPEAMKRITKKLDEETEEKIASGKTVRWTGDIKKLVRDRV